MSAILALDLSLTATGWATNGPDYGTIKTDAKQPLTDRLLHINNSLCNLIDSDPDLILVEDYTVRGPGDHVKTGMVHGVARLAIHRAARPAIYIPPATLKKFATGRGNAIKPDMRMALYQRLRLDIRDDNQVDAIWLWALGHHLTGNPIIALPKTHTDCLAKLDTETSWLTHTRPQPK